jgi:pyruvate/2-oxoglutarate dehydrogenase complex dihydrolipoamide dehydrogenase (E3) component
VTLFNAPPRVLRREDPDATRLVEAGLRRDGVDVRLGVTVRGVERTATGRRVSIDNDAVEADAVLVATGRRPNVEALDLDAGGVAHDAKLGVRVDDFLRTTNRRVYAAGDVCSKYQFTHAADAMARIVVRNALFLGRQRVSRLVIPWCTYTDPELAQVGLTEAEAKAQGVAVDVFTEPFAGVDRAVLDDATDGFIKVLVRRGTDRIVGATVVGEQAGALIAEIALAMTGRVGLKTVAGTIFPYPTVPDALKKIADQYQRTRLTPLVKWLLDRWLGWTL